VLGIYAKCILKGLFSMLLKKEVSETQTIFSLFGLNIKMRNNMPFRYKKIIQKLRKKIKNNPIKVGFLTRERSKWTYQSVYDILNKDNRFDPVILVSVMFSKNTENQQDEISETARFFIEKGMKVEYVWDNDEYKELKDMVVDILFYDQPWDIPFIHHPAHVSEFALTMYSCYGIQPMDYKRNYMPKFQKQLYRYYVEHQLNIERFERYKKGNSKNCVDVGYPKLDIYLDKDNIPSMSEWKEPDKIKIIYAPHHSFGEDHTTNYGTFDKNGQFILDLAKKHPETTWIFKPHPWLKYNLIEKNKIMTKEECEKYYNEWKNIGNVVETGDYFNIFKTCDLMITDSISFLGEFLPSGKPLIRLVPDNICVPLSEYGLWLSSQYYNAHSNDELEHLFNNLAINKNDYKKTDRDKLISEFIDWNESSAHKIFKYILSDLGVKE
jgi:hypothetical protein